MGICYERASDTNPEILDMAREIIEKYHPELKTPDGGYVRLCIMLAFQGGDDADHEPAVKLHGYPCYAVIKSIPYKQRVDKRADAEITIDKEKWESLTDRQQRALLDHEITHLEIKRDEYGAVDTDDCGRPKLNIRLHDWQLGGFRSIARRYGSEALEVIEARHFDEDFGKDVLEKQEATLYA